MSLLALMATAIATKIRKAEPEPADVRITKLEARIDDLNRQLTEAMQVAVTLGRQRDELRDREARHSVLARQFEIPEEMRRQMMLQSQAQAQWAQAQHQNAQLGQQANMQMHQNALGQQHLIGDLMGKIGRDFAQTLDDYVCNCVPARHDAFKGVMSGD
jgi:maltooligosyltrehalose synthase